MADKRSIMIILPSDNLGGAELYLFNIAKFYIKNGYGVDVFFLYREMTKKWRDVPGLNLFHTTKTSELKGIFSLLFNVRRYGKRQYDFIFTSHQHINAFTSLILSLRLIRKKKFICRESTSVYKRFSGLKLFYHKLLYNLYGKNIDLIICQTPDMKEQLLKGNRKFLPFNVKVIRNPIVLEDALTLAEHTAQVDLPERFIVAIGRLNFVKRFDKLIRAYDKTQAKQSYKLLILGEGKERPKLENLIDNLNLQERIFLIGHVENVFPVIKKASLGVITSDIEGFPNVLLQMYALNLRVVTTNCCGGLEDFPNLYLCKDNTEEEIATLCDRALLNTDVLDFSQYIKRFDIRNFINQIDNYA